MAGFTPALSSNCYASNRDEAAFVVDEQLRPLGEATYRAPFGVKTTNGWVRVGDALNSPTAVKPDSDSLPSE